VTLSAERCSCSENGGGARRITVPIDAPRARRLSWSLGGSTLIQFKETRQRYEDINITRIRTRN